MKYHKLLAEFERIRWAITPQALQGMLTVLEGGDLSAEDYGIFHAAAKESREALVAETGTALAGSKYASISGSTGLLLIDGPIIPKADMFSDVSSLVSIERLTAEFQQLAANPRVKDILLVMDTPGGNVVGVSEFAQLVKASQKPVDAFVYGTAASAGYWIASAARKIYSADTGEVGSIGVVTTYRTSKNKETLEIVSSQSPLKRPDMATEEGLASVQQVIDDLAAVFVETVAKNRNVTAATVLEKFGRGSVAVAARAKENGMIDGISTLDSILKQKSQAPGSMVGRPANHKTTQREAPVDGQDNATPKAMTAEELRVQHPEAVAQITNEATAAERARIQSIEALGSKVSSYPAAVQAAAGKVINDAKFQDGATASSVGMLVLEAVGTAQSAIVSATADGARALAAVASEVPSGDGKTATGAAPDGGEAENKARSAGIAAGMKNAAR